LGISTNDAVPAVIDKMCSIWWNKVMAQQVTVAALRANETVL